MIRVGIYGASGYTGQELLRILLRHPGVSVEIVTSRRYEGVPVSEVYPHLTGLTDLVYKNISVTDIAELTDCVFLALPHGVFMNIAPDFLAAGKKVIDLSADFRLRDLSVYEQWYGKHKASGVIKSAIYGLPEIYRHEIGAADFIANPGCYPTSVILGLAPIFKKQYIDPETIVVDSKSGVSGAGREPQIGILFCEADEAFKAYKLGRHRHTPEIEQELSCLAGQNVKISFTPHLIPAVRGIFSTIYANLKQDLTAAEIIVDYKEFYRNDKFVKVFKADMFPDISSVRGSNYCHIGIAVDSRTRRVIIVSVIDNLIKGAAGQAVQNMNIMYGLKEDIGLDMMPLFP